MIATTPKRIEIAYTVVKSHWKTSKAKTSHAIPVTRKIHQRSAASSRISRGPNMSFIVPPRICVDGARFSQAGGLLPDDH